MSDIIFWLFVIAAIVVFGIVIPERRHRREARESAERLKIWFETPPEVRQHMRESDFNPTDLL